MTTFLTILLCLVAIAIIEFLIVESAECDEAPPRYQDVYSWGEHQFIVRYHAGQERAARLAVARMANEVVESEQNETCRGV